MRHIFITIIILIRLLLYLDYCFTLPILIVLNMRIFSSSSSSLGDDAEGTSNKDGLEHEGR
jgi:hypothetical protein